MSDKPKRPVGRPPKPKLPEEAKPPKPQYAGHTLVLYKENGREVIEFDTAYGHVKILNASYPVPDALAEILDTQPPDRKFRVVDRDGKVIRRGKSIYASAGGGWRFYRAIRTPLSRAPPEAPRLGEVGSSTPFPRDPSSIAQER